MKTIIFTLGIFALFFSPASCSKGKLNFPDNAYNTTSSSITSKDGDGDGSGDVIYIDPPKPAPKPE